MSIRRRIALFLDPSLAQVHMDLNAAWRMEGALESIAKSLHSIDRKTVKRRQRVIDCRHPELHPELRAIV